MTKRATAAKEQGDEQNGINANPTNWFITYFTYRPTGSDESS